METIHWGILGTGTIAHWFTEALRALPDARAIAVGSRSPDTASAFADRFQIPRRYASYEALVADPDVDVVYIATPHPLHHEHMLLCLNAGKHVLCEKAFTINARQASEVIAVAQARKLFVMEALWIRFLPEFARIRQWLAEGVIGEVRHVRADLCARQPYHPESRIFNLALGGGALLDKGIYPVSFAFMALGKPERIQSLAYLGPTGSDDQDTILFGYAGGQMAELSCASIINAPQEMVVLGTGGAIKVRDIWRRQGVRQLILALDGQKEQLCEAPFAVSDYHYEAAEVHRCLHEGRLESTIMPPQETLSIMQTLDTLRETWNLRYPQE